MARRADPYALCLKWLALGELSEFQIRRRLRAREVPTDALEEVVARLRRVGAIDDLRTARACARTQALIKRHGPHRVARALDALGIERAVAAQAVREVFDQTDEPTLIAQVLDRHLERKGHRIIRDQAEYRRLYGHLLRRGFTASAIHALLRARSRPATEPVEE